MLVKANEKFKCLRSNWPRIRDKVPSNITRDRKRGILTTSQQGYLKKVINQFGIWDAKHVLTRIGAHFKLIAIKKSEVELEPSLMKHAPYASCGTIMYVMVCSRTDIAYEIGLISRFMSNPGISHWKATNWLLHYLKGTLTLKLGYSRNK